MFYKQINSCGQLVSIGTTVNNAILPKNCIQISKSEYDMFQRIFDIVVDIPQLTPINEKGEIDYASVQN